MNTPKPTWLHRLSGFPPGHIPKWLLSTSGCDLDYDLLSVTEFAILGAGAGLWSWTKYWPFIVLGLVGMVAFEVWVRSPLETVERKARALRRRAEVAQRLLGEATSAESVHQSC